MGQTLDNGIYLPSEGERNCYDGLAANWTTLDSVVGGYRAHVANENIHITSAERSKWNTGVTQAYVLRYASVSLTALGTVAFSSLDNTDNIKIGDKVLDSEGKLFALTAVDTANSTATLSALLIDLSKDSDLSNYYTKPETDTLLSNKANDSDVVHKSGNETVGGQKLFSDINAISNSAELGSTAGNNSFKVLDKNKNTLSRLEGGTFSSGMAYSYWLVNNGTDVFNGLTLYQASANLAQLRPYSSTLSLQLGTSNRSFSDCYTSKINGVEPSSLSLPSGNLNDVIDISGYLTYLDGVNNTYTAPVNGWIAITMNGCSGIQAYINGLWGHQIVRPTAGVVRFFMPVLKNKTTNILIFGGTIDNARFIPCQGNV